MINKKSFRTKISFWLAMLGPGLVVMFADTDAGSLITAAQSGATWGYRLLIFQFLLIPILFIAQELTVRLGLVTKMGHGELIKKFFGRGWAWFSISTLFLSCIGAIITEFTGIAGVGALFGISPWVMMGLVVSFLLLVAWTGNYRSVEGVAIFLGLFELFFLWLAWKAHPVFKEVVQGMKQMPITNSQYLYLAAGNVGAVIMPWMIFYQQSAVIDKRMNQSHLTIARWDTAIGAIITQLVMAGILIMIAATVGKFNGGTSLNNVQEISHAITPIMGPTLGKIIFSLAMLGASLIAALVVSLTAAWGLGEILGYRRSLQDHPKEAPWFYIVYTLVLILGGILVASNKVNLIKMSVGVEVMNALLLPIVLGFLYLLAIKVLPDPYRLKGKYAVVVGIILSITALFGLGAGCIGFFT